MLIKCPTCKGKGEIPKSISVGNFVSKTYVYIFCSVCSGLGWVTKRDKDIINGQIEPD